MCGLNNAQLIGRLGADATISHLTNGGRVANVSIATDESYLDKNSGDKVDRTEWHRIVTFQGRTVTRCFSSLYINDLISLFVQPRRKVGQDLFGFRAESRHTSRREHRPNSPLRYSGSPPWPVRWARKAITSHSVAPASAKRRAPAFRSPCAEQCGKPASFAPVPEPVAER